MTTRWVVALLLWPSIAFSQNLISDGQFRSTPDCCIWRTTEGAYIQPDWWIGPGVGGTVVISSFVYAPDGRKLLNIESYVPPHFPGLDPQVYGRETFVEWHGIHLVQDLDGKKVRLRFLAIGGYGGPLTLVPILWPMYSPGHYWVIPCPEVILNPGEMVNVVCTVQLPSVGSRPLTTDNYLGVGVDLTPFIRPAQFLLGEFSLEVIP